MTNKSYFRLTGLVFLIVFVLHFSRIINGWEVLVSGERIPMWVSWTALVLAGVFAFYGLKKKS